MSALVRHTHATSTACWELVTRPPPAPLARVLCEPYYGYVESTPNPLRRREYPGVKAVLIIELGPPLLLIDPLNASQSSRFAHGFLAAVRRSYALTEHAGYSRGIQVNLSPTGARRLFGIPMSQLSERVVGLDELLGQDDRARLVRIVEAATWSERFDLLDSLLLGLLARSGPGDVAIQHAIGAIERNPNLNMAKLARELEMSPRRLIERFRDQVGAPPKLVARIARFEQVLRGLRSNTTVSFANVAQRCGYSDQAHLIRDFHDFAGSTPSEVRHWLATTDLPEALRPKRESMP